MALSKALLWAIRTTVWKKRKQREKSSQEGQTAAPRQVDTLAALRLVHRGPEVLEVLQFGFRKGLGREPPPDPAEVLQHGLLGGRHHTAGSLPEDTGTGPVPGQVGHLL
jgi:hypothetical protein